MPKVSVAQKGNPPILFVPARIFLLSTPVIHKPHERPTPFCAGSQGSRLWRITTNLRFPSIDESRYHQNSRHDSIIKLVIDLLPFGRTSFVVGFFFRHRRRDRLAMGLR